MSSIDIANQDVLNVSAACNAILSSEQVIDGRFPYALRRNRDKIKNDAKAISEHLNQDILKEYNVEAKSIAEKIMKEKEYTTQKEIDSDSEYIKQINELRGGKYKEDMEKADAFLLETIKVDVHKIHVDDVPALPAIHHSWLYNILTDEDIKQ